MQTRGFEGAGGLAGKTDETDGRTERTCAKLNLFPFRRTVVRLIEAVSPSSPSGGRTSDFNRTHLACETQQNPQNRLHIDAKWRLAQTVDPRTHKGTLSRSGEVTECGGGGGTRQAVHEVVRSSYGSRVSLTSVALSVVQGLDAESNEADYFQCSEQDSSLVTTR